MPGSLARVEGLNSNLDLNGAAPPTVVPALGEWGPSSVPSTRSKRWLRWKTVGALVLALTVVVLFGYYAWTLLG